MKKILSLRNHFSNYIFKKKYYLYLFIFYSLGHVGIFLLSNSLFWDDWVLADVSNDVNLERFNMVGLAITGHMHNFLLSFGPWLYRLLTFWLMFLSGIAFDKVLQKYKFFDESKRFIFISLFLLIPLNISRVTLICFPYTLYYFLFFYAWSILYKNRFFSILCFFFSFNTNSLILFYILPFLEVAFSKNQISLKNIDLKKFYKFIQNNILLFLSPIIYLLLKFIYLKPSGIYSGYNYQFSFKSLLISPIKQFLNFISIDLPFLGFLPILIYLVLNFINTSKLIDDFKIKEKNFLKNLFFKGIIFFLIACFPYWILGHVPEFDDWKSRHQLLMPLGISAVVASYIYSIPSNFRKQVFSLFLSVFILINIFGYLDLYQDWSKQLKLISIISKTEEIRNSNIVVFNDTSKNYNVFNRDYNFYEWNGILKSAFNEENKIGLNNYNIPYDKQLIVDLENSNCGQLYKMRDFKINNENNAILVNIFKNKNDYFKLSNKEKLIYKIRQFYNPEFSIKIERIDNPLINIKQKEFYECKIS